MKVLTPHLSCVVMPSELQQAIAENYGEIYIITPKGPYKRTKLTHNRFIQVKVASIPGVTDDTKEEISFLPAGKVPYALLTTIVDFFRAVMTVKKAEQEAMAHILWNPEQGYHVGIPTQSVSKASVRYDFDDVKTGDIIILDIHSHNTMSAFFSGTDNNDDRRSICFSGVVGHLEKPEPSFVWRFNYHDIKKECVLSDIFDVEVVSPEVNNEWLNKVSVGNSWVTEGGYAGPKSVAPPWMNQNQHWGARGPAFYRGGEGLSSKPSQEAKGNAAEKEQLEMGFEALLGGGAYVSDPDLWAEYEAALSGEAPGAVVGPTEQILGEADTRFNLALQEANDEALSRSLNPGAYDDEEKPVLVKRVPAEASNSVIDKNGPGYDDMMVAEFGPVAAEAMEQIQLYMEDIQESDELLLEVFRDCYDRMTPAAQSRIQTNGL